MLKRNFKRQEHEKQRKPLSSLAGNIFRANDHLVNANSPGIKYSKGGLVSIISFVFF